MKNQVLFSLKDKSKKIKFRLLQFSFGTLRVKFKQCEVSVTMGFRPIFFRYFICIRPC